MKNRPQTNLNYILLIMTTNTTNNDEKERHATWLELFFDLVFVVIISQLSHFYYMRSHR